MHLSFKRKHSQPYLRKETSYLYVLVLHLGWEGGYSLRCRGRPFHVAARVHWSWERREF